MFLCLKTVSLIELPKYLVKPHAIAPKLLKMARFWAGQGVKFKPIPIETHYPTHASVHRGATYISAVPRQHPPDVG